MFCDVPQGGLPPFHHIIVKIALAQATIASPRLHVFSIDFDIRTRTCSTSKCDIHSAAGRR
ncbi:hypothetical protein SJ05684_c22790 [Sinorhizobium sojae CCBAU 05684]|uniref:Uncharacterized protein n=1 Tax=Sinorhizobium sojae CCBAU 05684 TaxID=716928 RepID=A0A249PCN9_9HYPH|nr:hypothetical protein SJ05684_c22790 [Sinorhizobium sojae CCBAU 05684]